MDLRQLKTFLKVAELGSLSKASDHMRVVQPALSRQIRLLEKEAGTPLFTRKATGMKLTAAGKELSNRIAGPVRQIESAIHDMHSLAVSTSGQVTLGMLSTVSYALVGRLGYRVATEYPEISLKITEGYSSHLTDWLQRGEVDVAITYGPAADFHMKTTELLVEELVLVGSINSDLRPDRPLLASELGRIPLIIPSHPSGLRHTVQRGAEKAGAKLNIRIEANSFQAMKELVAQDLGYTVLPLSSFSRELQKGELKYCPIRRPKITRQLILAHPFESDLSSAAMKVVQLAFEELTLMIKNGDLVGHLFFEQSSPKIHRASRQRK